MYTYVCRFYFWLSCHFVLTLNCGNALSCHAPARSQLFFSIYVSIFHQRTGSLVCVAHKNNHTPLYIYIYIYKQKHTQTYMYMATHTRQSLSISIHSRTYLAHFNHFCFAPYFAYAFIHTRNYFSWILIKFSNLARELCRFLSIVRMHELLLPFTHGCVYVGVRLFLCVWQFICRCMCVCCLLCGALTGFFFLFSNLLPLLAATVALPYCVNILRLLTFALLRKLAA